MFELNEVFGPLSTNDPAPLVAIVSALPPSLSPGSTTLAPASMLSTGVPLKVAPLVKSNCPPLPLTCSVLANATLAKLTDAVDAQ